MAHPFLDDLDVGTSREQPRCVSVTQVVEPNFEGQPGFLDGWVRLPFSTTYGGFRHRCRDCGRTRLVFPGGPPDGAVHRAGVFAVAASTFAGPVSRQRAVSVAAALLTCRPVS